MARLRPLLASALSALALIGLASPASADLRVFDVPDLDFKLDLYGWVQPRFTAQQADDRPAVNFHPNPAFTVQRARLGTVASIGKWGRAQVEVDFSREGAVPVDAFVVFTPFQSSIARLSLQLGQFRVPFSRQNLLPSNSYQLADTAYFVTPKFIVDRDIGAMITSDFFEGKARLSLGVFNGNEPAKGQTLNADPYFLYTVRAEVSPLGPPPRFEGDLRPVEKRGKPRVTLGVGAMRNRFDDKHFTRNYLGADVGAWFAGASLYAEFYYHVDEPLFTSGPSATTRVKQLGWNVQAGYFLPLPYVREHLELALRVQALDPNIDVQTPANDAGARDLDQSNPTWGYLGFVAGVNYFPLATHNLKLQASYELRNETKRCLEGQSGDGCTGFINNNLLVVQATAGF